MYFGDLQKRLIDLARERVRAGQATERGLARRCGISQPHMHHVLKNARAFSVGSHDRLLRALGLGVPDLLWSMPGEGDSQVHAVPIMRSRIGPGTETSLTEYRGHVPMPGWLVKDLVGAVTARLAPDLVLPAALAANDLVLLDQNPAGRARPWEGGLWVVETAAGLRARYLRASGASIYVGNETTRGNPEQWSAIPLGGRNILDVVRARIVWVSRKMETEPAGPVHPARQSDRSDRRA